MAVKQSLREYRKSKLLKAAKAIEHQALQMRSQRSENCDAWTIFLRFCCSLEVPLFTPFLRNTSTITSN
ncbi:unnamed protein product [Haemonchus placei]|uniref:5-formyltetrahydrofolate cyclo-ligase n=1 Tax=Haemonchus placei TaxID=6290 RepID=A0A0N4WVI7_HAEPC|nr:unnamed protein product [Haemonchus placei]